LSTNAEVSLPQVLLGDALALIGIEGLISIGRALLNVMAGDLATIAYIALAVFYDHWGPGSLADREAARV
jgi:hypothetical protein